jgi:hypothetical protein
MQIKTLALAAALTVSGFAHAAGGNLGNIPPSASFAATHTGAFMDVWTFNLATPSIVAASVTNVEITFGSTMVGGILGFSATLNGVPLNLSSSSVFNPPVSVTTQILSGSGVLGAGMYQLVVSGTGVTGGSASYGGNIVATPVPEPETYALMMAGLAAVGFVAARRRRQG